MLILDALFINSVANELILTKLKDNSSFEKSVGKLEYIRCFLWHPDFVYVQLFGESRMARLKVYVKDKITFSKEALEWLFAFPMNISNDNQIFVTNHKKYRQLDVDTGTYYILVGARKMTNKEIEKDPEMMKVYGRTGMPIDVEVPYEYRISFCKSKLFRAPKIFRVSDSLRKVQAILRERGRPQDLENTNFYDEIYVLNSDYEPVLLEDSKYEFWDEAD